VYYFKATDANGCILEDSVTLKAPLPLSAVLQITDNKCFGSGDGSITIVAQGGTAPYSYQFGSGNFSPLAYQLRLPPGTYPVQVKDNNGCVWSGQGTVDAALPLVVQSLKDTIIQLGDQIQLIALPDDPSRIDTFWWAILPEISRTCSGSGVTCQDPIISPTFQTEVTLFVRDTIGCISIQNFTIKVRKDREVYVPTGFTPGEDRINDRLAVHSPDTLSIPWIKVYDRWGGLIWEATSFEPNQLQTGWDGTFKGKACDAGVYVWVLLAQFSDGLEQIYKGEITLVR
jgi:gliding motility-associated-like protein